MRANCSSLINHTGCCCQCGWQEHTPHEDVKPLQIPSPLKLSLDWGRAAGKINDVLGDHCLEIYKRFPLPITIVRKNCYVQAEWGAIDVLACYFQPRLSLADYETALEGLAAANEYRGLFIGGDYYAKGQVCLYIFRRA